MDIFAVGPELASEAIFTYHILVFLLENNCVILNFDKNL